MMMWEKNVNLKIICFDLLLKQYLRYEMMQKLLIKCSLILFVKRVKINKENLINLNINMR